MPFHFSSLVGEEEKPQAPLLSIFSTVVASPQQDGLTWFLGGEGKQLTASETWFAWEQKHPTASLSYTRETEPHVVLSFSI